MLHSLKGILSHTEPGLAVVECSGVGFACRTTSNTLSSFKKGDEITLLTYLHVREDALDLFGFGDGAELKAFKLLLSVSGVGPKAALSILSDLSAGGFALAVAGGDSKSLTRAPGIGIKLAQRIILELKDKIDKGNVFSDGGLGGTSRPVSGTQKSNNMSEAISALAVLGFSQTEAAKAASGVPGDLPTPEIIKAALKNLSG